MSEARRAAVRAVGLEKSYQLGEQTIRALGGVSLTVGQGEFVAVMGPSGSGKSTLLHLLGLLDSPDAGSVEIGGRATAGLSDDELTALRRDELGFIFQNFELVPNLSARENVLLPAEVSGRLAEAERELPALAEQLGIADRLDHRPRQLSGGQRQRVALARALSTGPGLLLLDEPLSALDAGLRARMREELAQLQRDIDIPTVLITHDQADVQALADEVFHIAHGEIRGQAEPVRRA